MFLSEKQWLWEGKNLYIFIYNFILSTKAKKNYNKKHEKRKEEAIIIIFLDEKGRKK